MSKKSFILYLDQQDLFNKLPDDIAGKLIKHIFSYVNCEDPKTDELIIDVAFASIKQALKRDLEKWTGQREQRSEAGKKSAEKRANENQRKPTTVETRSTNPTVSVSVNDSVSVSVSDIVNDNGKKEIKKALPELDYPKELNLSAWNEWKLYRKEMKIKAYQPTTRSEGAAINDLLKMSNSHDEQYQIIQQSMAKGWKGLFELKNNNLNGPQHKTFADQRTDRNVEAFSNFLSRAK